MLPIVLGMLLLTSLLLTLLPMDRQPALFGRHAFLDVLLGTVMGSVAVGAPLVVLQNPGHGPMLVNVRDTRIALGRGEAMKILVEETSA